MRRGHLKGKNGARGVVGLVLAIRNEDADPIKNSHERSGRQVEDCPQSDKVEPEPPPRCAMHSMT